MAALELALVGAFPFPLPQGSQVYFEDQARALIRAGCTCALFTYGRGVGPPPDDLEIVSSPAASAPSQMRSGPSLGKPRADAALLRTLRDACATRHFDAVLAHNAEAAAIAIAARRDTGVPVIYVVHTLLGVELSAYLPRVFAPLADLAGRRVDRALAQHADGSLVLARSAERVLAPVSRGPIEVIPPGLEPAPTVDDPISDDRDIDMLLERFGLERDRFFFYSGNLDGYQELDLLAATAHALPKGAPPIVVATHQPIGERDRVAHAPLRLLHVDDFSAMRSLMRAANALLLTRRRVGGYPIKLLNYMEAGRPIIAFEAVAEGLVHGESAWLLDAERDSKPGALAEQLARLAVDAQLRAKLGDGARRHLLQHHDPDDMGRRTLRFVERVCEGPNR